jgi:hypothetical protein
LSCLVNVIIQQTVGTASVSDTHALTRKDVQFSSWYIGDYYADKLHTIVLNPVKLIEYSIW